jgi:ParB/RepB/Spo0J family partition protein
MAKKTAAQPEQDYDKVLHISPDAILADDNIRMSLRAADVDRMVESITERGGVQEPISVESIPGAKRGEPQYRLLKGFIRHAAVSKMNASGAGLTLPVLVRPPADPTERLKIQVTENVARASLSPIDTALSIRRLLEAGVPRTEIRALFARAGGGKGATVSPVSNSWLNIHLNMLSLPAEVIAKIHEGAVSMQAAYELGRVPADRVLAVLEKAEDEVKRQAEREEKDEQKLLKDEQAEAKEAEKAQAAAKELETAKAEVVKTEALMAEKLSAFRAVQAEEYDPADPKAKDAYMERLKAAETDYKAAQGLGKKAKNKVAKLMGQKSKVEELKDKLAEARSKPTVGPKDVRRAAQADRDTPEGKAAAGKPNGAAPALSAAEIRQAMKDIAKGTETKMLLQIVGIFNDVFSGQLTPKMALEELEKAVKGPRVLASNKK